MTKMLLSTGKRKTSIARVLIREGTGKVRVNDIPIQLYQPWIAREKIMEPLYLAGEGVTSRIDIDAKVEGGGFMSRAEAVRMGIARGLVKWTKSEILRDTYLKYDRSMLAGDSRRTEPKKFGGPSARTRKQKSYR
ncbi:MAG: 30S ribosomal protein S9 [Candidatus Bathyarchaeia archaeon]|nr:30S ribosomal protein S9 [Candidatus Bathyarchaeota archaeon]